MSPRTYLIICLVLTTLGGCLQPQVLVPEPTALDLDRSSPTCPGLSSVSVAAGPTLSLTWGQATDNVSESSKISYLIYIRTAATSYDLVSPSKIVVGATSTLISTGINVGQTYTLWVACKDEGGNVEPTGPLNERSVTVVDTQAPSQITNLSAAGASTTSILLNWSPSDDGESGTTASNMVYRIYASSSPGVSTAVTPLASITGQTAYTHTGLNPFMTWYYRVVAVDSNGNVSNDSNEAAGSTNDDVTAPVFTPNSGIAVAASGRTETSIRLEWTQATDNVASSTYPQHRLYRCTGSTTCDPFTGTLVATLSKSTTTYEDVGLTASTVYVYGVRAVDYRNNVSINTDKVVTSTLYASASSFYAYPTLREANTRLGTGIAVANVYGPQSGFPDLIVGAPNGSEAGSPYQYTGCIHIFEGTGNGTFSTTPVHTLCDPAATASGNAGNARNFGYSITKGDFNEDGRTDLAVSNPERNRVYIYYAELAGTNVTLTSSPAIINRASPSGASFFGMGLCAGNMDNVGADDLIVASSGEQCASNQCGRLLIYSIGGSPYSVPSDPSVEINPWNTAGASNDLADIGYSANNSEQAARACAVGTFDPSNPSQIQIAVGSGDVDRAGANNNEGIIYFYRKTAALTFQFQKALIDGQDLWTVLTNGIYFGESLGRVRNLGSNPHLYIGAPYDSSIGTQNGAVWGYEVQNSSGNLNLVGLGEAYLGRDDLDRNGMGTAIDAFDRTGDGSDDLLVIGSALDDGTSVPSATNLDIGNAFTYTRSGLSGFPSTVIQTNFNYALRDVRTSQYFGTCIAHGDFNDDGKPDVAIGAPGQQFDEDNLSTTVARGVVYVYYGKAAGEIDFANPSQKIYGPNVANTSFGISCLAMDFNGDNRHDLLVGAPFRDIGGNNRGAVYVYYGQTGQSLPTSASFTLQAPAGEQVDNAYFGAALTAGDFDASGHGDLAVSAIGRNSGAANNGRVYVYFADTTSHVIRTGSSPLVIDPPANQANQYFGNSLMAFRTRLSAGDAADDLVSCSPGFTAPIGFYGAGIPAAAAANHGRCWVWHGSTTAYTMSGSSVSDATPDSEVRYPYNLTLEVPATIHFGSAATAGDWDNDGVDDAVICASRQTARSGPQSGSTNAGVCFVFRGRSDGTGGFQNYTSYSGTTVPTGNGMFANKYPESSTVSYFGGSGATALAGGAVALVDINDNGRDDLLVGEPYSDNLNPSNPSVGVDSGRVYIDRGDFVSQ